MKRRAVMPVIFGLLVVCFLPLWAVAQERPVAGDAAVPDLFATGSLDPLSSRSVLDEPYLLRQSTVRSRFAQVNLDRLMELESIRLNLFDDVTVLAVRERVERRSAGSYTWFGRVRGADFSSVVLTVENGDLVGQFVFNGELYNVRRAGDRVYEVRQLDPNRFHGAHRTPVPNPRLLSPIQPQQAPQTPRAVQDDGSVIDIMVVYTDDVAFASLNVVGDIQHSIDVTNQTYNDSFVNHRFRLVHTAKVDYVENLNSTTTLDCLTDPDDGCLDEVHTWRNTYHADIVSLYVLWPMDWLSVMGIGYLLNSSSDLHNANFAPYAFNVVVSTAASLGFVLAHESGHNMGAHHDVYAAGTAQTIFPYSHGYVWSYWPHCIKTVMAYDKYCTDRLMIPIRVGIWSNVKMMYAVCPLGVCITPHLPIGDAATADNARTLNETASTVATFRQSNRAPVSEAGGPYSAACQGSSRSLVLDGSRSSDPDGDALTYSWTTNCPAGTFDNGAAARPTLTVAMSGTSFNCTASLTVTDPAGLSSTPDSATISIQDTVSPVLSPRPADLNLRCDTPVPAPVAVAATDACDPSVLPAFGEKRTDGTCPMNYTLARTWTARDECGNAASHTQTVTVLDSAPPVLSVRPADVTLECGAPVPNAPAVTAADVCDPSAAARFSETRSPGSCPQNYTLARTWTSSDVCGNTASHTQWIAVLDRTAPVLNPRPANITAECSAVPAAPVLTATDVCDPNVRPLFSERRIDGVCPSTYSLIRTWTAPDACGNSVTHAQNIAVQDTTPPAVQCNAPPTIVPPDAPVSFTATATDNCTSVAVEITGFNCVGPKSIRACQVRYSGNTITIFDSGGVNNTISWTVRATDACGVSSTRLCNLRVVNPGRNKPPQSED